MAKYHVERVREVDPSRGRDCESAFAVYLAADGQDLQVTVEFVSGSRLGSNSAARNAVRPYLDSTRPPRRLIVDRTGNASLAED